MSNNKLFNGVKFGIYLAFILPLVFTSRTMHPWHFGKVILWQALVEILLVLGLIYFSFNKDLAQKQASGGAGKKIIKLNLLDWLVLFFIFLQFISAVFGVNFNRSFWGDQQRIQGVFTWLHFGIFYLLLRQFFTTKKDWQNLGIWILIISFISSFLAWFGKYLSFLDGVIVRGVRLSGMIGNPLFLASYLIIPAFLGFALFFVLDKNNRWRWPVLLISVLNLTTLIFTRIRGAFVGLVGGIFVGWIAYLILGKSWRTKKAVLISGLLFLIFLSGAYVFNLKNENLNKYLSNNVPIMANILNIKPTARTASTRLMAWRVAFNSWQEKPIFGWGVENFQDAFDKHYNPEFLKYSLGETVWDKPHNYHLEVLATMGIIGLAAYLGIIIVLLLYAVRIIKKDENENKKLAFVILIGAIIAYLGQNSFGIESANPLQLWFWLIAFISFYYTLSREEIIFYNKKFLYRTIGWLALFFIIITPYLIYKNYTFYKSSVLMGDASDAAEIESLYLWQQKAPEVLQVKVPFLWEQAMFLTQDLSQFDGKGILKKETLEPVAFQLADIFGEQIKNYPTSYVMRFWAGQLYGFMGEFIDNKYFDKSEEIFRQAWDINRTRQSIPLMIAKNFLIQGRNKEGIAILEEVVASNDEFDEPHWFLGLALMQDEQPERGIEELAKGEGFGIGFNKGNILYLIDIYAERKNYEKIISLYEILIRQEPDNAQYYASLAVAYASIDDEENVIINLNKAVELQPALAEEAKKFLQEQGIDINKYK